MIAKKDIYKWKAVVAKLKDSNCKQRIKLLLKLLLRIIGIHKPLFLAAYREDICINEQHKDDELFRELSQKGYCCKGKKIYGCENLEYAVKNTKEVYNWSYLGYIAIATENLDRGGLEEVVAFLAEQLAGRGICIKVFCFSKGGMVEQRLRRNTDIDIIIFDRNASKFEAYITENPPLLINTHFVSSFWNIIDRHNTPCVETIHNMYVFLSPQQKKLEQKKSGILCGYIAVSQLVKEYFIRKYPVVNEKNVRVIGNAAKLKPCTVDRNIVKQNMKIEKDAFVFLSTGSIDPRKNQIGIVRAFEIFFSYKDQSAYLIIAGEKTNTDYYIKLTQMLIKMKCKDHVLILPYINNVSNLLVAADCFVLDSYYEGWSVAATEAVYFGLPVIHSSCGSYNELTQNGKYGIGIPNPCFKINEIESIVLNDFMSGGINDNVEYLVKAMICIYDNRFDWKRTQERNAIFAKMEFSPDNMIYSYICAYQDILETREGDCV